MTHFIVNLQKDYAFSYNVNELDKSGYPNVSFKKYILKMI